jgi:hypothetical protein
MPINKGFSIENSITIKLKLCTHTFSWIAFQNVLRIRALLMNSPFWREPLQYICCFPEAVTICRFHFSTFLIYNLQDPTYPGKTKLYLPTGRGEQNSGQNGAESISKDAKVTTTLSSELVVHTLLKESCTYVYVAIALVASHLVPVKPSWHLQTASVSPAHVTYFQGKEYCYISDGTAACLHHRMTPENQFRGESNQDKELTRRDL